MLIAKRCRQLFNMAIFLITLLIAHQLYAENKVEKNLQNTNKNEILQPSVDNNPSGRFLEGKPYQVTPGQPPLLDSAVIFPEYKTLIKNIKEKNHNNTVAFSPDGKILATSSNSTTLMLWNTTDGSLINSYNGDSSILSVAFSPDGKKIASGSNKKVRLWNIKSGKLIKTLEGYKGFVSSIDFSEDGSFIITSSKNTLRLWNLDSGSEIYSTEAHEKPITEVSFSSNSKTFASASTDSTINLWNTKDDELLHTFKGNGRKINTVDFSPDGKILASGGADGIISLWDISNRRLISKTTMAHNTEINSVTFSSDGNTLASASNDNTVKLWSINDGVLIYTLKHNKRVSSVAFNPDGKTLASASGRLLSLWNISDGVLVKTFSGDKSIVRSAVFSPDSKTLASSKDETLQLWDIINGRLIFTLKGHKESINSIAFSPDGSQIATASNDTSIKLWRVSDGVLLYTLEGCSKEVSSIAFSPDGETLAASCQKNLWLWDTHKRKPIRMFTYMNNIRSLIYSPDGIILAIAFYGNTIKLWDFKEDRLVGALQGHDKYIRSIAFNSSGEQLVSSSADKTIKIWNIKTRELITTFKSEKKVDFYAAIFSPDDKTIISSSSSSLMHWSIKRGTLSKSLKTNKEYTPFISFSPNGKLFSSTSYNIYVWSTANWEKNRLLASGKRGNWFSCQKQQCLRGDDGSFIEKIAKRYLTLSQVNALPPPNSSINYTDIKIEAPSSISIIPGQSIPIAIKVTNTSISNTAFWLKLKSLDKNNIIKIASPNNEITYPAAPWKNETISRLNAGETKLLHANIYTDGELHYSGKNFLAGIHAFPIQVLSSNGAASKIEVINIDIKQPDLKLLETTLDINKGKKILQVKFNNSGKTNLKGIKINLYDKKSRLSKIEPQALSYLESTATHYLAFVLPDDFDLQDNSVSLSVGTANYPKYSWVLPLSLAPTKQRLNWVIWILPLSLLTFLIGLSYFKRYRHPIILNLSATPSRLLELPIDQLAEAKTKLVQTKRFLSILKTAEVNQKNFDHAIDFISCVEKKNMDQRQAASMIAERIGSKTLELEPGYFELKLPDSFTLNVNKLRLFLPDATLEPNDALATLKRQPQAQLRVTLIIGKNSEYQRQLYKATKDITNKWVAPQGKELTRLFLATNPDTTLAEILAGQLSLQQISPYSIGGGVSKESVFFGRRYIIAHIINRDPANYLLVGSRQVGKSSLLKAIERRYAENDQFECLYQVLSNEVVIPRLAAQLGFSNVENSDEFIKKFQEKLRADQRHYLFLIDEADKFIAHEREREYPTLQLFRRLSEEGNCSFILAGFWELYEHAVLDYQSPLKNFAEILQIAELEKPACIELATQPMRAMNLRYNSDAIIHTLVESTGQRANLIAIACQHILVHLSPESRIIEAGDVHSALYSDDIRKALSGWASLGSNEAERCLNRIIVYLTVGQENFSSADILTQLEKIKVTVDTEKLERSLEQLELGFILGRNKNRYFYRVPLFREMIIEDDPEVKLHNELKQYTSV